MTLRLNPETELLRRRNGDLQFGWDPESAVVVPTISSADQRAVVELVRMLDGTVRMSDVYRRSADAGLPRTRAEQIVTDLQASGHIVSEPRSATGSVRVHGDGPLADSIAAALSATGLVVSRSRELRSVGDVRRWTFDLVILADRLVWDPTFISELLAAGIDHLVVRTRDGKGIVGPLVVPGITSCLLCADLTRSGYDPDWPWLAAQLLGRNGTSSPITASATTAFALAEITAHLSEDSHQSTSTLDTTIEIDVRRLETGRRHWPVQSDCQCQFLPKQPKWRGEAVS
jgi:hypothetical protein